MNTVTVKILVFFLSVFIMITVFSQFTLMFEDDYKTETAVTYSSAEVIPFKGICIRDEKVITYNGSGVLSYPNPDGSRIAKNSVVAYVYDSEDSIYINQKIKKLNDEIDLLENAQSPGTTEAAQQEFISSLITEKYQQMTSLSAKEDYSELLEERNNFLSLMNIYKIILKEESSYNDRIGVLENEIVSLESKQRQPKDTITVEDAGYFVSYTDGFEDKLSLENINDISVDTIKAVVADDNKSIMHGSSTKVGKIISGYKWKMIGAVSSSYTNIQPGLKVRIRFSSTPDTIEAVVESIEPTEDGTENVIIISCDKLTYDFVQHRVEKAELVLNDYEGIKVSRDAIRFNSANEKGVYILLGQRVSFRKVDVIYENDKYILSRITTDKGFVSMYDDIIVDGTNINELIAAAETETETVSSDENTEDTTNTTVSQAETSETTDTESNDTDGQAGIDDESVFE